MGAIDDNEQLLSGLIKRFGEQRLVRSGLAALRRRSLRFAFPRGCILFPFLQRHEVVYLQARLIPGREGIRWTNPTGITKPIFNLGALQSSGRLYVCEGVPDTVAAFELGLNAIGILGGSSPLSSDVLHIMKKRSLSIVPDNDQAGDTTTQRVLQQLKRVGATASIMKLPFGKDLNEYLVLARGAK